MAHLIAIVVVLGISGLPAGSLLCGLACAPEQTAEPSCHARAGTDHGAPVMDGIHLCDEDAAAVPMIASPAFSIGAVDVAAPHMQPRFSLPARVIVSRTWESPPRGPFVPLAASPSVLRI